MRSTSESRSSSPRRLLQVSLSPNSLISRAEFISFPGAFGGLLARLINEMDGVAGYHGWQWIFILEGIATVVVAAASFWMLFDYPDTAKFLTAEEKHFMQARLALDNDGCSQAFKYKFVKDAFLDWKVWVVSYRSAYQNVPQCS